jgi:hypothetical protein
MSDWTYQGCLFPDTTTDLSVLWGFVYLIEDTTTGMKYCGKKFFTKAGTKQIKGKKKKIRKTSDWVGYWGSNEVLKAAIQQNGTDRYTRTILHLCHSRAECSYFEAFEIFTRHALLSDRYFNEWVSCRIRKAHLKKIHLTTNVQ